MRPIVGMTAGRFQSISARWALAESRFAFSGTGQTLAAQVASCYSPTRAQPVLMTLTTRAVQRLTLAAACLAQGMMVLDVLIVSVAPPSMQRELRLSPSGLEWVVSAYVLVLAALTPSGGTLAD